MTCKVTTPLSQEEASRVISPIDNNFFTDDYVLIYVTPKSRNEIVYFTLDGSDPSTESPRYAGPIKVINNDDTSVILKILFYDFTNCYCTTYTKEITFNQIPVLDIDYENEDDIESLLDNITYIRYSKGCKEGIESLLNPNTSEIYIDNLIPIESLLNHNTSFISYKLCGSDSIESALTSFMMSSEDMIESVLDTDGEAVKQRVDMYAEFPRGYLGTMDICKDEYVFDDYVWTNNTNKVLQLVVRGELRVDDDLVIDGQIVDEGLYDGANVCPTPTNTTHTYYDGHIVKDNILPGQTVTINIVNHYARPIGVYEFTGGVFLEFTDPQFFEFGRITNEAPCTPIESVIGPFISYYLSFRFFFTTESQGTITPIVDTFSSNDISWDWGDGDRTLNTNSPSYTYTDNLPNHDVNISNLFPSDISQIYVQYGDVTRIYLDPYTNLEILRVDNNENLTNLDVSKLTELQYLYSYNAGYNSIDISNNTELIDARIGQNRNITNVDVTNNTKLQVLTISNSSLSSIDVTNNQDLVRLSVHDNNLNSIDVTNNPLMDVLFVHLNNLSSIDLSNNTILTQLDIRTNNISTLDITNNNIIDWLQIDNNQLTSNAIDDILINLDNSGIINGYLTYSNNPGENSLTACTAYYNLIAKGWTILGQVPVCEFTLFTTSSQGTIDPSIVTSDASLVDWAWGDGNQTLNDNSPSHTYTDTFPFHDVDIFGIDPLVITSFDITDDAVVSVDSSDLTQLTEFFCGTNNISVLDISNNTQLTSLICGANNISVLDVSNNTQLTTLTCGNNNISVLDVSNNTQLTTLGCFNNNISVLDVSNNTQLTTLTCGNNNISVLDISNNTQLTTLGFLNCNLNSVNIDQILIDLDGHGQTNGSLNYQGNLGESSLTACTAYDNLIGKGWTIVGQVPDCN